MYSVHKAQVFYFGARLSSNLQMIFFRIWISRNSLLHCRVLEAIYNGKFHQYRNISEVPCRPLLYIRTLLSPNKMLTGLLEQSWNYWYLYSLRANTVWTQAHPVRLLPSGWVATPSIAPFPEHLSSHQEDNSYLLESGNSACGVDPETSDLEGGACPGISACGPAL